MTPPAAIKVSTAIVNAGGYNGANMPGVTRWRSNTEGLAKVIGKHKPDTVLFAELSNQSKNKQRPLMDVRLRDQGLTRSPGGSDGRYGYYRPHEDRLIASGKFEIPKNLMLNGDTKQAAWHVLEHEGGVRELQVSWHGENQNGVDKTTGKNADDLRVESALWILGEALAVASMNGVNKRNILIAGDFNSQQWVVDAMKKKGWRLVGSATHDKWDDRGRTKLIHGFVHKDALEATSREIETDYTDHRILWIERTLVA